MWSQEGWRVNCGIDEMMILGVQMSNCGICVCRVSYTGSAGMRLRRY